MSGLAAFIGLARVWENRGTCVRPHKTIISHFVYSQQTIYPQRKMPKTLKKMVIIVGPTAAGKSDLAVALARRFNAEVISADSRQIYKGMDLGSGKITKREMRGVPHHLLSVVSPNNKNFSAHAFKVQADRKISEIEKRGRMPILIGGTGFWIDSVAFNKTFPEVPPNFNLRKKLEKLSAEKLFAQLQKLNPQRAKSIDAKNPRRLMRAIEIAKFLKGKHFEQSAAPTHQLLFIGLDLPDKILEQRIKNRLLKRIKRGMLQEVVRLHKKGVSWKRLESFGLEYKFSALHLQGKINKKQMLELLHTASRQYSKRQRTWFKRNQQIHWLNPKNKNRCLSQATALVKKFI